jgi:hypothetical protein
MDELARLYAETHDEKVKAELEHLSRQLATGRVADALKMQQYKNYFISGGGLLGRVFDIAPGGRTIVVKRLEDRQTVSGAGRSGRARVKARRRMG